MSNQQINKYDNEQTFINDSDWFDIDAFLGNDTYESRKVSFGTIKAQLGGGVGANIYNSDGTLTGNRLMNVNNKALVIYNADSIKLNVEDGKGLEMFTTGTDTYFVRLRGSYGFLRLDKETVKPIILQVDDNSPVEPQNKGAYYNDDYTTEWDETTDESALTTLRFVTANGTTANRPTNGIVGQQYLDTDINKLIVWNGSNWIDAMGTTV